MRTVLAFALLAFSVGCTHDVRLMASKREEGIAMFSVFLNLNTEPTPWQVERMERFASLECGSDDWSVVEEGTKIQSSPYFSMAGPYASAGESQSAHYYWVVRCRRSDKPPGAVTASASTPPPAEEKIDFTTGMGFLEACEDGLAAASAARAVVGAGYCIGYLDALQHAESAAASPAWCIADDAVSRKQAMMVVVKWLKDHPERLHEDVHGLVRQAFVDAFKCSGRASP